jgi:hypothetical protein
MAEHPWRCSQCGTINEPVANSCRTCGRWPSLFDLEDNVVDETSFESQAGDVAVEEYDVQAYEAPEPPEPVTVEVQPYEPEPVEAPPVPAPQRRFGGAPTKPVFEEGEAEGRGRWISWLVPIAFVVYFALSYFFSGR